jgi:Galactose oxidase, central domain
MLPKKLFFVVITLLLAISSFSLAQKLQNLVNQPPDGAGIGYLLTDGSVIFQGNNQSDWWKLTANNLGSYVKGTWSQIASLPSGYVPLYFAGAVLADGRVVIVGGEYNNGPFVLTNRAAIYDPKKNTWTSLGHPKGWGYIGDSPGVVLPDGKFLVGRKLDKSAAVLDPSTLTWTVVGSAGKSDFNAEEGWTLMPDGTVLTYDVKNAPHSEKYISSLGKWVTAGSTIVDLHSPYQGGCIPYPGGCYNPPGEVGPGILRTDGTVFATGSGSNGGSGPGHTAIYHPGKKPTDPGKWTVGPDFPNGDNAGDSFAALLPNGRPLVLGKSGTLYEFDGKNLISGPFAGLGSSLMVLPTGQVIVAGSQVYTSTGTYKAAWAPSITTYPSTVTRGSTYKISGKQFNGLSQAASFGDEDETATNYPLVRITNQTTHHVFYAKTHDHSTMAVATGSAIVSTNFDVPAKMEIGASSLVVVANGIPSKAVSITVN